MLPTTEREGKHSSPRFAKIMGDKLAELISQEKQLEEKKIKKERALAASGEELNGGVKLEPQW